MGLPVVASRVGGNPELVEEGQTGLLFPSGSDGEFVSAVETLLLNSELRWRMGEEARRRALEKYQVKSVLEQFKSLYLALLQEKGIA